MHVKILISGYLSENNNESESWEGALTEDSSNVYYNLKWKSK